MKKILYLFVLIASLSFYAPMTSSAATSPIKPLTGVTTIKGPAAAAARAEKRQARLKRLEQRRLRLKRRLMRLRRQRLRRHRLMMQRLRRLRERRLRLEHKK